MLRIFCNVYLVAVQDVATPKFILPPSIQTINNGGSTTSHTRALLQHLRDEQESSPTIQTPS